MDMVAASVLPLKRYADLQGRSTRTGLIAFYRLIMLANLAICSVDANRCGPNPRGWTPPPGEPA